MRALRNFLHRKIDEFNEEWGFELNIKIQFWNKDYAEYEGFPGYGVIRLDPNQRRADILEDLFHELGHAALDQYLIPRRRLSIFRNNSPKISRQKSEKLTCDEELPPPTGWVSWYSMVTGTEDFCEVLSARACSGYKMRGSFNYGGWVFSIDREPKLKKKILAVRKILIGD